jgi:cellulose synthase/poly-beta-1,6-N-acetylglucosamine synthase-like glycosyltransferase
MLMQFFFVVIISLLGAYTALLIFYRIAWQQIPSYVPNALLKPTTKITVIVPARNEAGNIGSCLQSLHAQTYPQHLFEVIVVDDFSEDETASLVNSFSESNIKLLQLKDYTKAYHTQSYKKIAIDIAINNSTGELMVTTDADCVLPPNWLATIASFYEEKKPAFIAMPVTITPATNFISVFQSLDFMTLQGITGASVYKKFHSMCNGANLAYTKKAFNAVDGFNGIDDIASGDDMLLMHKIYMRYKQQVLFLKSKDVIVQTQPIKSIGAFFNQRIRWASKADKYEDKRIFIVLVIVYIFNFSMLTMPLVALLNDAQYSIYNFHGSIFKIWLFLVLVKTIVELLFLYPISCFFNKQKLLAWFPLMQPFHILYTVIAGWLGKFGSYKWKGRKVK